MLYIEKGFIKSTLRSYVKMEVGLSSLSISHFTRP